MTVIANLIMLVRTQWLKFAAGLAQSMLMVTLFCILILVISKGLMYFWPQSIDTVSYQEVGGAEYRVHAYLSTDSSPQGLQPGAWLQLDSWSTSRQKGQVMLKLQQVLKTERHSEVARLDIQDGRFLLATPLRLLVVQNSIPLSDLSRVFEQVQYITAQQQNLLDNELSEVHLAIAELRRKNVAEDSIAMASLNQQYLLLSGRFRELKKQADAYQLEVEKADGSKFLMPLKDIRKISYPNRISWWQKVAEMMDSLGFFLSEDTRDGNQAGGVFPAVFGTILMVLIMTVIVSPLGIMAAVYLTEYAPNNTVVALIRLAVSNLASIPSVIYGVFGLGFFVYQVGGSIDTLFYADKLPAATFGAPGLLWASLTMALLTLPVVIVATEEGLRRVPGGLRMASYALGATRLETVSRVVLPAASSSLMTGIILAIARAAGEVAPMLMVGAVKYAPTLPVDLQYPYLHLERQFMHLGVLIYDGAFHGQYAQQGSGFMFAACLFLLVVVLLLNMVTVVIRNRLQSKYG